MIRTHTFQIFSIPPRLCFTLGICIFLVSCAASVTVKPDVALEGNSRVVSVRGSIVYDGNPCYLPATVEHKSGTDISIKYEYVVSYEGTGAEEILTAFIPTTLLGTPTGSDDVVASGRLELSKGGRIIKTYVSQAIATKPRSIFAGGVDKSELRRMALTSLKKNIENQMKNDTSIIGDTQQRTGE
jgi:hypothetical protein